MGTVLGEFLWAASTTVREFPGNAGCSFEKVTPGYRVQFYESFPGTRYIFKSVSGGPVVL